MAIKALCTGVSMSRLQLFFHSGESGSALSARIYKKQLVHNTRITTFVKKNNKKSNTVDHINFTNNVSLLRPHLYYL